jgi:hypothetical protein
MDTDGHGWKKMNSRADPTDRRIGIFLKEKLAKS